MNVLITGGTGFIGSRLALKLLEEGHRVRVTGQQNNEAESANKVMLEQAGAEVVLTSLTDQPPFEALLDGVDWVFHLAAAQHEANVGDQHFVDVNVDGTRNLLEACVTAGVDRFVYGSTIGVYGLLDGRIEETSPCNPDNIYGKTKLAAEKTVLEAASKLPVTIIRISETFGPGDRRLLKLFRTIEKGVFFVVGSGRNLHQLIFVDDLVRGLTLAASEPAAVGEICLLAGREPVSTREMVDTIARQVGGKVPRRHAPLAPFMLIARILETVCKPLGIQPPLHRRRMDFFKKSFTLSRDRARSVLSFEPELSFAEGVERTADWYRQHGLLESAKDQK